jgi:hypothetical protein
MVPEFGSFSGCLDFPYFTSMLLPVILLHGAGLEHDKSSVL